MESGNSTESTRLKYLHFNSTNSVYDDKNSLYHINLTGHSLKNVKRVGVKQFSTANSVFNITESNNILAWYECYYASAGAVVQRKPFNIIVPVGKYTVATLIVELNRLLVIIPEHKFAGERELTINFEQVEATFLVKLTLTQPTGFKYFLPIAGQIWRDLGFHDDAQTVSLKDFPKVDPVRNLRAHTVILATPEGREFTANHAPTLENIDGLYLVSKNLTNGNTYECRLNSQTNTVNAVPCDILEWIAFDGPSYSYIHYNPNYIHWHYLNHHTLNEIDIGLYKNDLKTPLKKGEHAPFNLVLVFETVLHDEYTAAFSKQYVQEGYDMAHKKDKIIFKK